ncbi:hypothetical protein CR513_59464, partial [Mucuna pruriens]
MLALCNLSLQISKQQFVLFAHANTEAMLCNGEECRILLAAPSPDDCTSGQKTCRDHKLVAAAADDDCFGLCCFPPLP